MNRPLTAIDFEFNHPSSPGMGLISCSLFLDNKLFNYWLRDPVDMLLLTGHLNEIKYTHTLVGYSIQQAEARCVAAMGLNPNEWQWRDLLAEWQWLRNCDNKYKYGKIIDNAGFPKFTVPPKMRVGKKASQEEIDYAAEVNQEYLDDIKQASVDDSPHGMEVGMEEAGFSMLDCQYFFEAINILQYREAAATKRRVRDGIIIGGSEESIQENRAVITEYNAGDVADLLDLADAITEAMKEAAAEPHLQMYKGELIEPVLDAGKIQLDLGDWCARLAKYGYRGIPLNKDRLQRLLKVIPELTKESKGNWNKDYIDTPIYRMGFSATMLEKRSTPLLKSPYIGGELTADSEMLSRLIGTFAEENHIEWPRTRTGQFDTSAKVIERYATGESIIKQYQRHKNHLSSMKAFTERDGKIDAMGYIGNDWKQRPDFGAYGTQSSRNAAKAKSFCFLGSHWMRILVDPEPGFTLIECDYSGQEVLIGAVLSGDSNLLKTYLSPDVYMTYAQLTGMYPSNMPIPTEEERAKEWFKPYKLTRSIAKTLFLSMQYGAGFKNVAAAVRDATKDSSISDEQGREWVAGFADAYPDYAALVREFKMKYKEQGYRVVLQNGWRMGPDNQSLLSASNVHVQGTGACVLMEACKLCDEAQIPVIATLHDALTFYCPEEYAEGMAAEGSRLMRQAAFNVLGVDHIKIGHPEIVRHGDWWIHSEKAQKAWSRLEKYFADLK